MTPAELDRLADVLGRREAWVIADLKLVYLAVPKNACTSIKWQLAALAGEDLSSFRAGLNQEPTGGGALHDRRQWQHVKVLSPEQARDVAAQVSPDRGWFVFGVTRDPWSRVFAAWQNKFLLQAPGTYRDWKDEDWYPSPPTSAEQVITAFAAFVDYLVREPDGEVRADRHFADQCSVLEPDVVPYSAVYDIRELDRLRDDLEQHVTRLGIRSEEPVVFRSTNATPLQANGDVFTDEIREKVDRVFARDLERFGDRWDFSAIASRPSWSSEAMRFARAAADYQTRVGELRDIGLAQEQAIRRLERRTERLAEKLEQARRRNRAMRERKNAPED